MQEQTKSQNPKKKLYYICSTEQFTACPKIDNLLHL